MLTEVYDDWLAVVDNLGKTRNSWGQFSRILIREGADPKVSGNFYEAVTQAVLLFGVEMWVLTPRMERALDILQYRVAQRLTRRQTRRQGGGSSWDYPPLEEAMGSVDFQGIMKSVTRWQNTVAQYIAKRPILDLSERSDQRPGVRVSRRWWEQAGIDLDGAKKRAAEIATVLESETDSESESDPGRYEESSGASWSSGAGRKSDPHIMTIGRK